MASLLLEQKHTLETEFTPEMDWQRVEAELEADFELYWPEVAPAVLMGSDPTISEQDKYATALEREKSFFNKVYEATQLMASENDGQVSLLFDIDHTLVEKVNGKDVIRPAFPLLVHVLEQSLGDRLEVGFLSSRNAVEMEEVAEVVGDSVNTNLLLSSTEYDIENPDVKDLVGKGNVEDKLKKSEGIVDPLIIKATREGRISHNWFDTKLVILQEELANPENEDRSFVFVDDFPCGGVIKAGHPRLVGVYVLDEMQGDIRWANMLANAVDYQH